MRGLVRLVDMKADGIIRSGTGCVAMLCAALLAQAEVLAASSAEASDEAIVIAPRRESKPAAGGREWFKAGLSDAAYQAARAFGSCVDWKHYDATTRLGAIRGIAIAGPAPQTSAKALAGSAIGEPVAQVRSAAIALIRERKDTTATAEVLRFWRDSYDDELGFDEAKRVAAVAALRDIGDRRAYDALLHYVMLELHTGAAQAAGPMSEVNITGNGINLPIQLPSIETMSFHGTIIVPAMSSLKGVTGQDFGRDVGKWREWVKAQPEFKK